MSDDRPPSPSTDEEISDKKAAYWKRIQALLDRPIPPQLLANPEVARRSRLMTRFGIMGAIFGLAYAFFYLVIGHWWGAEIILTCTAGVMISPFLMRWYTSVEPAANFFSLILTLGFLSLCFVEGGVHGHAIAWLVSVPLCSLVLAGTESAIKWVVVSFCAASLVVGLDLAGINLPVTYDPRWNSVVSAAGFLGLGVFMFLLGYIFEEGRASAFARMQTALGQLAASNGRLVDLNKEKNEFLGIVAHDLRAPLTVILTNGELLGQTEDREKTKKFAGVIVVAAERMRRLITNLLDVNAIEEGKFASKLECCNLGALVEASVGRSSSEALRKQIEIRVAMTEKVYARADPEATMQILDNLISNAVKYSPPNSTVQVHLLAETKQALVRVRDDGPGISEDDQKRLFQKFSRLSARPTGGESSTGLGLAIAKKLAETMSGSVECHSTFGHGAAFTLRLGLWLEALPQNKLAKPAPPQPPAGIAVFNYTTEGAKE